MGAIFLIGFLGGIVGSLTMFAIAAVVVLLSADDEPPIRYRRSI